MGRGGGLLLALPASWALPALAQVEPVPSSRWSNVRWSRSRPSGSSRWCPSIPATSARSHPKTSGRRPPLPPFDLTGTWFVDLSKGFADYLFGPPYPKFGPEGVQALVEAPKAQARNEPYRDAIGPCYPPGMPTLITRVWPHAFIQLPTAIYVISGFNNSVRQIFLDGRQFSDPDLVVPSYNGESIGHWEGDTPVVETVAINDTLKLMPGMGHSAQLKITGRLRLSPDDPNTLVNEMTWEDPEALVEPFKTTVTYGRDREGSLIEFICHQNDRTEVDAEGNTKPF